MKRKFSDILTTLLALVFAGSCAAFAGYKIFILQGLENPPADMGLNFSPPPKKVITDEPPRADFLTTGSISGEPTSDPLPVQALGGESPVLGYRLLTVIDSMALVRVNRVAGQEIMALTVGEHLPGAGAIRRIERSEGRWRLVANGITLQADRR